MNRDILLELPSYDASKYDEVDRLISIIEEKLEDGDDVTNEIAQIHSLADKVNEFTEDTFRYYWSSTSKEELIEEILIPYPPEIDNLTQNEILIILKKMTETDIEHSTYYLELLTKNSHYEQSITNLVYWPNNMGYESELSLEDLARIIFNNEIPPIGPGRDKIIYL
jgi:hypothetical protein